MYSSTDPLLLTGLRYDPFGMLTVGRSWEGGSGYRYGFNNKESISEIVDNNNSLDFGARIYNARLGIWLSIDPAYHKYPEFSPYTFSFNNPIVFSDPDGREPSHDQVLGLSAFIQILRDEEISNLEQLTEYFGGTRGTSTSGTLDGVNYSGRFLYSSRWGWLDMRHFGAAGYTSNWLLATGHQVLAKGENNEKGQETSDPNSAWAYDDLVSNLLGVTFETYLESEEAEGKDFVTNLETYLNELGVVEDPQVAPNFNDMADTEDEAEVLRFGEENKTYNPLYNIECRTAEIDITIIEYLIEYMDGKCDDRSVEDSECNSE